MCGRYHFGAHLKEKLKPYLREVEYEQLSFGEIAPSQTIVVRTRNVFELAKWGITHWQKKSLIINARLETVLTKQFFVSDYQKNRCVILADGFYEWDKEKNKYLVHLNSEHFYLAGFYTTHDNIKQAVILTRQAPDAFQAIHNRVPVILNKEEAQAYLRTSDIQNWKAPECPELILEQQ